MLWPYVGLMAMPLIWYLHAKYTEYSMPHSCLFMLYPLLLMHTSFIPTGFSPKADLHAFSLSMSVWFPPSVYVKPLAAWLAFKWEHSRWCKTEFCQSQNYQTLATMLPCNFFFSNHQVKHIVDYLGVNCDYLHVLNQGQWQIQTGSQGFWNRVKISKFEWKWTKMSFFGRFFWLRTWSTFCLGPPLKGSMGSGLEDLSNT